MSGFITRSGFTIDPVTRAQMLEIDRIAVEETGPTLLQMMENAGRSLAEVILERTSSAGEETSVLVLAGNGGNGGGGICAARRLASRLSRVDVCRTGRGSLSAAARAQLDTFGQGPGVEVDFASLGERAPYDLVVDAMIGYGLDSAPTGTARNAIEWINRSNALVVALDIPSGLDTDTASAPGACVSADITVTLHMPKPGLASAHAGELLLADLGIPESVSRRVGVRHPRYGQHFVTQIERVT